MELHIPKAERNRYFTASAQVGGEAVKIWEDGQAGKPVGDPRIFATAFINDPPGIRERMIGRILSSSEEEPQNTPGYGGRKVRGSDVWNSAEGRLLTLRALMFFCQTHGCERAYTVDRWANVLDKNDYSCPHSHYDSRSAVVYYLELGDDCPGHPLSGRFEFLDSRIPFCCSRRADAPTRGLMPELVDGLMILFPSELIHYVHPYMGSRPRITLAFNISEGAQPAGHEANLGKRVEGSLGPVSPDDVS